MPRVTIDRTAFTEDLRLRDPDSFYLLEYLRFHHGAGAFDIPDETRRKLDGIGGAGWSLPRFASARQRLVRGGYLLSTSTNAQRDKR